MQPLFLELDTYHNYLDFKLLDENNNVVLPKTFYLQLLNKDMSIHDNKARKIYPSRFKPCGTTTRSKSANYKLAKISEVEVYFLFEIDARQKLAKNIETFGYYLKYCWQWLRTTYKCGFI